MKKHIDVKEISSEKAVTESNKIKGAVVFYIDVGQLPPEKVSELIEKVKEENKPFLDVMPKDVTAIWLPLRPNSATRVEYLPLEVE